MQFAAVGMATSSQQREEERLRHEREKWCDEEDRRDSEERRLPRFERLLDVVSFQCEARNNKYDEHEQCLEDAIFANTHRSEGSANLRDD